MRRRELLGGAAIGAGAFAFTPRSALAVEARARRTGIDLVDGWITVSVGLQDLLAPADRKKLYSGFVNRFDIRVYLYRDGEAEPMAAELRRAELVYDIWGERFEARVQDSRGRKQVRQGLAEREAVFTGTALWRFPIEELALLDPEATYRVRVRGDLNPVREELLQEAKRWLLRPSGRGREGTGDSFFGMFVSVFVNPRIEDSERQVTFWSQPFRVPAGGLLR